MSNGGRPSERSDMSSELEVANVLGEIVTGLCVAAAELLTTANDDDGDMLVPRPFAPSGVRIPPHLAQLFRNIEGDRQ